MRGSTAGRVESPWLRAALRRMSNLVGTDAQVRKARVSVDDIAWIRDGRKHAIELVEAACRRYADRPCLGVKADGPRASYTLVTYAELWERVVALASGLHRGGHVSAGDLVALFGASTLDWIVADLACLYLGAASVPLPMAASAEDIAHALTQTVPRCVLVDAELVARLPATTPHLVFGREVAEIEAAGRAAHVPHDVGADRLFSVVFTSGSTGGLKGVMVPEQRWTTTLRDAVQSVPMPTITLAYLPLSHMAGRIALYTTLMGGGTSYLVASSDMSTLFDDLREVRPTSLTLVPRVSGMLYQQFRRQLVERGEGAEPEILRELRETTLGGRLCFVTTGAAPTAPEVVAFLERCFEVHVVDTYGSTESGRITVDGKVQPWISYKLVDVPDLGYTRTDEPYPRGELAVKSEREAPGYINNPEATARLRDSEGYLLTGDIVEERAPGHIVWIDRKHAVIRLANGESVNVSRIEDLYVANSAYIDQLYLHGSSLRGYLLAVVVPDRAAVAVALAGEAPEARAVAEKQLLRSELARIAAEASLRPHEVPRELIIASEPFSTENGLLTDTNKPRRPRLAAAFAAAFDAVNAEIEARQLRTLEANSSSADKLRQAVAIVLGIEASSVGDGATFVGLGGDSLGALRLAALIEEHTGVAIAAGALLDPAATIGALVARVEAGARTDAFAEIHGGDPAWIHARDLVATRFLPTELLAGSSAVPCAETPRTVLLTGANGFLGRFLLLELLARAAAVDGRVIALVRGSDDGAARTRLVDAYRGELAAQLERHASRLTVYRAELSAPRLGLGEDRHAALASEVDAIVHNGALVNHAYSYAELFEPNVVGTAEVLRLALTSRAKPVHFVSTTGVAVGARGRVTETAHAASLLTRWPIGRGAGTDYALGYTTSKWAAEVLLHDTYARTGLPVTIHRCSMILPHPKFGSQTNHGDAFARLVYGLARTGVAPTSFFGDEFTGTRHYDGLPVDVVAEFVAAVATQRAAGFEIFHVRNSPRAPEVSLDTIVDWMSADGIALERLPYPRWLERFRGALEALPTEEQRRSPLPILHRYARPASDRERAPELDTERFASTLKALTGRDGVPQLDRGYIVHCIRAICGVTS